MTSWSDVPAGTGAALIRLDLAGEPADRGRSAEARAWRDRSLSSVRGDAELLLQLARDCAPNVRRVGDDPIQLDERGRLQQRR